MLNSNTLAATSGNSGRRSSALCAAIVAALAMAASSTALADPELDALKQQVQELQKKIDAMAKQQAATPAPVAATPAPAAAPAKAAEAPASGSLSAYGITLYGIVDIGLQYQSYGAPASDYFPATTESYIQKNSRESIFTATSSNLGQSRIGLQGKESLWNDWSAVFKLETFFNPTSGDISDALKSQTLNNGRTAANQGTNVDSSIAGQLFNSAAYGGLSHPLFGTITYGRQLTPLADGINKYDPMGASNAFSIIGFSGTAGGGGDTEDRRLDNSIKYDAQFGTFHFAALYQLNGVSGTAGSAKQLVFGAVAPNASFDVFWSKKEDAIATSVLSAAQVTGLAALGLSPSNSLAATISDNTTFSLMGKVNWGHSKFFGGYEHIQFANPENPLVAPTTAATITGGFPLTIGGYVLAVTNNNAYPKDKILQIEWIGWKYSFSPNADLTLAGYRVDQSAYGITPTTLGCRNDSSSTCSGRLLAYSGVYDYHFTKRFDAYFGAMWDGVQNGLQNGYIAQNTINPTIGVRYTF